MNKRVQGLVLAVAVITGSIPALAAEQTVTLKVDMWCATCPIIVKNVLGGVPGVIEVEVSYPTKTAVVTFEDEVTSISALTKATREVGFPSVPLMSEYGVEAGRRP